MWTRKNFASVNFLRSAIVSFVQLFWKRQINQLGLIKDDNKDPMTKNIKLIERLQIFL